MAAGATALALLLAGCGGGDGDSAGQRAEARAKPSEKQASPSQDPTRVPGVGDRLQARIPGNSTQAVTVRGEGVNSPDATVRLYEKHGEKWSQTASWRAHNGKKGWTKSHREGDKRSPVGVFTLTDAGGVLADPGAKLPYSHSSAFTPPTYWPKKTRHDFDYVIAVDYNRVKGTSPLDPTRPQGKAKGGSIWLHRDHGSGTSGCVSVSKAGMEKLLRTLDPKKHPVVAMGDKAALES
ncbi:L,D-transpeptidase family protein [Streptomyces sp. NPDC048172]|uniref:L,D-transpeptidase family protein n=1 Tax=Streptomyces sp. NPDC048172 TaxID=3365505 RepID=UPI00371B6C53